MLTSSLSSSIFCQHFCRMLLDLPPLPSWGLLLDPEPLRGPAWTLLLLLFSLSPPLLFPLDLSLSHHPPPLSLPGSRLHWFCSSFLPVKGRMFLVTMANDLLGVYALGPLSFFLCV